MDGQITFWDLTLPMVSVNSKIRLIELFAGYGSQAMALRNLGADFEHWFVCEFDEPAIKSYNAVHGTNFPTMDVREIHGKDLQIVEKDRYAYLLTYLLLPLYGYFRCRSYERLCARQRNEIEPFMGSEENP